jgi:hypothetical protein
MGGTKVSVNVLLPDTIFSESGGKKKMAYPFSYANRYNILSESIAFLRLCIAGVGVALDLLATKDEKIYSWKKRLEVTGATGPPPPTTNRHQSNPPRHRQRPVLADLL